MVKNRQGLIIINLGSPDSYFVKDVRQYLNEFLLDERVIDMPALLRHIIVKGFIVPFRSLKSAAAYKTIWTDKGSPLKVITEDFATLVRKKVNLPVAVAMRYQNPTPMHALSELENQTDHLEEILLAPMYPHYAMSSYETALEHVKTSIRAERKDIRFKVLKPFYNESAFISSLAKTIESHLTQHDFDAYLFSYHGLPIRHLKKSDTTKAHCYSSDSCCEMPSLAWETCYKHQVKTTTKLVAEKLNLDSSKVKISFQSRLGSDKWIQPFTDKMFETLPKQGVKRLLVVCPAFVADCLETLEEMDERGKEIFIGNGGEVFERVLCLNTSADWVETFCFYVNHAETDSKNLWN